MCGLINTNGISFLPFLRFDGLLSSEAESRRFRDNHETPLPPELEMDPEWIWVSGTGCKVVSEVNKAVLLLSLLFFSEVEVPGRGRCCCFCLVIIFKGG